MWVEAIVAVGILVGLGLLFATILAVAYKKLRVYEDPRIDILEEMLPGSNCGACGQPGCRAFAEKLVGNEVQPGKCTVSPPEAVESIAGLLGVEAGFQEKVVARLLCAGGKMEAHNQAQYQGLMTCRGAVTVTNGYKECVWGCLGLDDCVNACTFDAMYMNDDGLPVVIGDKCTACGDCVDVCPRDLFTLMPVSQKLIVQCRSLLEGETAEAMCSVACNACGRCASDAAPGLIEMKNNLPVIDYELNESASPAAIKRCPTNAIVWVEGDQFRPPTETPLPLGRVEIFRDEESQES